MLERVINSPFNFELQLVCWVSATLPKFS